MKRFSPIFLASYWTFTILSFVTAIAVVLFYVPTEATMGNIQKIFYLHLPSAICTFLACLITFVASIGYLIQRKSVWDDLASAAARVAVQLCTVVLLTGMIWGRSAWGQWWTWSPRLTFVLVLWLLYVVYVVIRISVESSQRRAIISAVYGILAFLDVPLVYLSVHLMPDIHPTSISLISPMKLTLGIWFIPVMLLTAGLIVFRFRLNAAQRSIADSDPMEEAAPVPLRWVGGAL